MFKDIKVNEITNEMTKQKLSINDLSEMTGLSRREISKALDINSNDLSGATVLTILSEKLIKSNDFEKKTFNARRRVFA